MKSIQEYIDERPVWPDGTQISGAPVTNMQWLIWSLAAAGKFFEGYVVYDWRGIATHLERVRNRVGPKWVNWRGKPAWYSGVENYTKTHPGFHITADATGSEAGIKKLIAGEAQIGASDVFMSDKAVRQNPQVVNIPLCISAQMINYNIPGLNAEKLKLDGTVLAGIYSGKIREWDAAPIATLNPSLKLPHQQIIPIRRAEGSGDTFIFTQFLTFSDSPWADNYGYGTTITWPVVPGSLEATGNNGMVQATQKTAYSVAYIGVSYSAEIAKAGLGTAWLKNQADNFLLPTKEAVQAAAAGLGPRTPPDERVCIAFAPGEDAYPLTNYEYAVVSTKQADAATAAALRKFLALDDCAE
jgi:phosphate transport system substrate-binding protein